ncbi:MAG: ion channel protein Tsx [Deltaproteobacteria bacterium]|nr:ion channel protein Tsx [Deltaproteobacteria bacterium]
MSRRSSTAILLLAFMLGALLTSVGRAEQLSLTNVQLLHGGGFDDWHYANATSDRRMSTVTLEHFGAWEYGDNYFFTDLTFGKFVDPSGARTGERARLYHEWTSRVGVGRLARAQGPLLGPIRDVLAAGQIGVGAAGFWAALAGGGIDLALPAPLVVGVNVYARKDAFNRTTFQVTPFWELPFTIVGVGLAFRGYLDVAGTDDLGLDVNTQPQLLLDVGALAGTKERLQAGIEWYLHRNKVIRTSAPQAMVRWIF